MMDFFLMAQHVNARYLRTKIYKPMFVSDALQIVSNVPVPSVRNALQDFIQIMETVLNV